MTMVRPSIQPSSLSCFSKAEVHGFHAAGVAAPRNPMIGNFPAGWECAANGQVVAPPSRVMKSRRRITTPEPRVIAYHRPMCDWACASQQKSPANVRDGSLADSQHVRAMSALPPKADISGGVFEDPNWAGRIAAPICNGIKVELDCGFAFEF